MPHTDTILTNTAYASGTTWAPVSLVNATYKWTVSPAQAGEYYVELAGGGDPSLTSPDAVAINAVSTDNAGTLGSLNVETWAYGDNDSLGYSTLYVRLTGNTDPDLQAPGYIGAKYVPVANDDVTFQFTAATGIAGSDQSAVELDDIEVLTICTGNAGSPDAYLQLDQGAANGVKYAGGGTWYLDLGTSGSASIVVTRGLKPGGGLAGLYLKNSGAIALATVDDATVRLVDANITTLVVGPSALVYIDSASTVGTVQNNGGTVIDYGAAITTWSQTGGTGTKSGADAFALNLDGGTFYNDGTGTATIVQNGGTIDSARDGRAKSVTYTLNKGTASIGPNVTLTDTLNSQTTISA